jgi:amino acid adenylation domain-containing protein/non-ribosomal peptide synthase protein (TIGR01720 family)
MLRMYSPATIDSHPIPEMHSEYQTLVDLLRVRARHQPEGRAYTFLTDEGTDESNLTYGELDRQARAIGASLQSTVVPGDRVLLLYPPGLEYIAAFFGCLYAGAIAVPAYPPRHNRNLLRLQAVVTDAQATVALTTSPILSRIAPQLSQNSYLAPLVWLVSDQMAEGLENNWQEPALTGEALALIQYTSGSTSAPKGVMVSHRNLLHNEQMIQSAFQQTDQSVIVGWLPLYHDMGLIGNVIQPLFIAAPCILMSPTAFLQKPFRWLQAISHYRATTSGGPNFAYDLCVSKISDEQRATLDLSTWSTAFNGSELVRRETLERFSTAFARCGFRPEAFRPCYGLAEATLLVSGRSHNRPLVTRTVQARVLESSRVVQDSGNEITRSIVSCGGGLSNQKIRIVNPEALTQCAPDQVGEVWVAGPSIAQGYWNNQEETQRTFHAHLSDTGEGPFLRTGDLGFGDDGELFITGRLKDLIIIRGLNHYPQDIELTVEKTHSALRPGCGAAFSVEVAGEERLVIVQEVDHRKQFQAGSLIERIKEAVAEEHEVQVHAVVLIKLGTIPKTSSGKLQRYACRDAFVTGVLKVVSEGRGALTIPNEATEALATPATQNAETLEVWLRSQIAAKLGIDGLQIDVHQPITRYGLDSLTAIELMHAIEVNLKVVVPFTILLESFSIAQLVERMLTQLRDGSASPQHFVKTSSEETADQPLSPGQQALWFLHQVAPESAAYNIGGAVRVRSDVDTAALRRAFQTLVSRHLSLHMAFPSSDGKPVRRAHEVGLAFNTQDVSAWSEAAIEKHVADEIHRPFDLEHGPLFRVSLLSRATQDHILILAVHHIVTDFWSLALLMHELEALYSAEQNEETLSLPLTTSEYGDYVRWQNDMLESEEGERLWNYWRQQLGGEPVSLNLPTDRPRPPAQTYRGASRSFDFNPELTRRLKELGRRQGATLYMTMLAAFQTFLARYTGQTDITVGSPSSNRTRAEFQDVVGYFVNSIVLRSDLSGDPTFETFLLNVRRTVLEAFAHQEYPFALLVERLLGERDASRSPLFQVMFILQQAHLHNAEGLTLLALNEPGAQLNLGGLHVESLAVEHRVSQFDLTLAVAESSGGLKASLEYNIDLFDEATIVRMIGHFRTLLESIVDDPAQRLAELPLLTNAERQQLLDGWNATAFKFPPATALHRLFEEQVARTPERTALMFEDQRLSYAELNRRANQLARYLGKLGVGPDVLVGICAERSVEMVVGLVGILKAGGAYLPLDPQYPRDRLSFMLSDARVNILLTQPELLPGLLPAHEAQVVCLDKAGRVIATHQEVVGGEMEETGHDVNPPVRVTGDNLAYVIYTSGSTGNPKAAMNSHRAIINRLLWMQQTFPLDESDRVLQKTPFSFDVSVWEFFWPLLTGACLVVARADGHLDPAYLVETIAAQEITTLHFVPSMLSVFLEHPHVEARARSLRRVISSGEALSPKLQQHFFERFNGNANVAGEGVGVELHNLYGPTEAAVDVTWWACQSPGERRVGEGVAGRRNVGERTGDGSDTTEGSVPIGRPIANTQIYLLDEHLQPVPPGVPGELYIGGIGLARGYLRRPAPTAERFIPNPFSLRAGMRLYKTGDLARYLPDGNISFLGRTDFQVKIRGFRIELGEIEAALRRLTPIREAVVLARADEGIERRLVAYLVIEPDQLLTIADVRRSLDEKLPAYMVPSAFVFLDSLPLTSNGKINQRALPAPEPGRPESEGLLVSARNPTEEMLASIWAELLRVEKVGIHDNFFELGGDSILSIQIVARANRAGLGLTPRQIFQYQTIAQLAAVAGTNQSTQSEQLIVSGAVPLTPAQHWFFEQKLPNPHHWNQSVLLGVRHALNPSLLERALKQLLIHHDALRMRFMPGELGWEQFNGSVEEIVPFSLIDLSGVSEPEQTLALAAAVAEAHASLNISTGPLLRAAYFDLGPEQPGNLLLVIHHLVVDGVSWRILLEDLQAAYQQDKRGEKVSLPPKTTSFKTWAGGLTEYALSASAEQELPYWLTASPRQPSHLPVDFHGGANTEASARTVTAALSVAETRALLHEVPAAYRTYINEVLLAALAQSFSTLSGEPFLLIDVEGHGREELLEGTDLSRTVGWFTAIYPVLLKLKKHSGTGATLKAVKEQLRQIPRHGVGYGVSRYLHKDAEGAARLAELPQAEVSFNYLGQLDQVFADSTLFENAREIDSRPRDPEGHRRYLLEINGSIIGGQLKLSWTYSESVHRQATIERAAQNHLTAIQEIIAGSRSGEAYEVTSSDFPLANLAQPRLAQLLETYEELEDIYPLAPTQQGLLFHSLYAADPGIYVEQVSCVLRGQLNIPAFELAWQKVIERHTILRTAFVWENLDEPLQVVTREVALALVTDDWRGLSVNEQAKRLDSFLRADRARGFDLQAAPLMRLKLHRVADAAHQFVWSHHHLLLDGWSLPLILNEVFAFYEALSQGRDLHLTPGQPYLNYINWLRQQDPTESEAFWRRSLAGFSTPTPLILDRAQNDLPDPTNVYGEQRAHLSLAATSSLKAFARSHHLTLNTLLQGAWALLLNRYSGTRDVVFGTAVSGRPVTMPGAQTMVGIFINTLPVRVQVPSDGSLSSWLQELQVKQSELQKHEHTALAQIQGWGEVPRGMPLFESVLILLNYPITSALHEPNTSLGIENLSWFEQTNYPLTMQVTPGRELLLKSAYDQRRFDAPTIERILGHFQTLLEAIGAEPEPGLADVSLLTEAERRQVLLRWNDTQREYAGHQCLHELFEERVKRTPDVIAVSYENESVSYSELNRRANKLAHHLRKLGVSAEVLVGICVERSIEMVVGLLGILKAGAAYVPLDSSYPLERLSFMMEDAALGVLLTQEKLADTLPSHWGHTICLDTDWATIDREDSENPSGVVREENLAYVIYTSGSTGKPKGAMLNHRGIVNCLRWMQDTYKLDESDCFLLKTSLNFDPSVWELFWTLGTGGRVVIARPEGHLDSVYLVQTILREKITSVYFVPPMLRVFVEEAGIENATSLRRVICGGEGLPKETMERFFQRLSGVELHHSYGPTETSIAATEWHCEQGVGKGMVPIGRPLANTEIYLLDEHLRPAPVGVAGELYIGGVGVGRGYVHQPKLTGESFLPHPFSEEAGARLYRTGDVGRYLSDGTIEFVGRRDAQVKIRGYRIELGEIEAVLCGHPMVEAAVVVAREEAGGDK